jgi:two-component system phosphate regulon sensor histidine kinase PhoR/two-component system sensor histidine kinase VicK
MEIKKTPKQANQFWSGFFKQKIIIAIVSQIAISLLVGTSLIVTKVFSIWSIELWVIIAGLLIVNLTVTILILISSTQPTKELLAAVLNVAGERTNLTPPNPNTQKNERTGFRDALQTIYKLSSSQDDIKQVAGTSSNPQPLDISATLDMTTCGFVALDNKRMIIYANKSAPIHIDNNNIKVLDLIFNGNDTLNTWLDDCEEHAVHAEHVWTRIPDKLPDEENRRFFDVIASYQKGAATETVLSLIERTSSYIVDEENLDFIAFAAHELRGPITVIRGYLDVLEDELNDVLKDDQHELFHRLVVSANRLSGYINNILNTSRYDRRHLKVHLAEDTAAAVYDVISDDMQLRASSQNRILSVNIPKDLPTIAVDQASMSEVFGNLIDNAIKYSNEGGIINVSARVYGDFIEISVQDHGIGMPDNVVNQLFQKFYRSHRSRETVAGTGIGLYISKAIVESHGGTISVRSEEGRGSTFTVLLPIYATVADKLKAGDNSNEGMINEGKGWINNHSMFRG